MRYETLMFGLSILYMIAALIAPWNKAVRPIMMALLAIWTLLMLLVHGVTNV